MNNYKVFKHDDGRIEAVKQDWSWLGFFFRIFWALVKRLQAVAGVLFVIFVVNFIIYLATQPQPDHYSPYENLALQPTDPIRTLINIDIVAVLGLKGNSFRESSLINNNFQLISTVIAPNPDIASAKVINSQDENNSNNNNSIVI